MFSRSGIEPGYVAFRLGHWAGLCRFPSGTLGRIMSHSIWDNAPDYTAVCPGKDSPQYLLQAQEHSAPGYVTFRLGHCPGLCHIPSGTARRIIRP